LKPLEQEQRNSSYVCSTMFQSKTVATPGSFIGSLNNGSPLVGSSGDAPVGSLGWMKSPWSWNSLQTLLAEFDC